MLGGAVTFCASWIVCSKAILQTSAIGSIQNSRNLNEEDKSCIKKDISSPPPKKNNKK